MAVDGGADGASLIRTGTVSDREYSSMTFRKFESNFLTGSGQSTAFSEK